MKAKLLSASILALSLAACTIDPSAPSGEGVAARILADIGNAPTRASGESWDAKDIIGISTFPGTKTDYTNVPYEWDGSKFNAGASPIYFQSDEAVTFCAYYPYDAAGGTLSAVTDADAQKKPQSIDFLYASGATADKTSPVVRFTGDEAFRHCMSQMTLSFEEGDGMTFGDKLSAYSLKGLKLEGGFDSVNGVAQATSGTADLVIALENAAATGKKYTASPVILFPQELSGGKTALEVTVDGNVYRATLTLPDTDGDGVKDNALRAGYNYRFPVRVSKKGLEIGTAEILPWNEVSGEASDAVM